MVDKLNKEKDYLSRVRKNLENGLWYAETKHKSTSNNLRQSMSSEENRKLILDFEKEWGYLGKSPMTIFDYVVKLHRFAEWLKQKSFRDVRKEDLISYFDKLKAEGSRGRKGVSDRTLDNIKVVIKIFYKWLNGGENYPDCVKWMETKVHKNEITADMILTQEEIEKLVKSANNWRDKAIVSILYESPCRISEFLGMRIRDIKFDDMGARITVDGKTGEREVRLVNSVPYLKE